MQLIDTHVHLNFDVFEGDLASLSQRWREAQVVHLVHSCVSPAEFERIQAIADEIPELSLAVGLHPLDTQLWHDAMADQILSLAQSDPRVVAIGEMGLDLYKADDLPLQKEILVRQLEIARDLNKPVIIHCREAATQLKEILEDFISRQGELGGVMHCWGGNPQETQWFLDLGFYISFSGIVTFKNAKSVQESAKIVPKDRLLIETDCPFLAPNPKRGKRNEPAYVRYVAEFVASLRGVPLETLAVETTENACNLFQLSVNSKQSFQLSVNSKQ